MTEARTNNWIMVHGTRMPSAAELNEMGVAPISVARWRAMCNQIEKNSNEEVAA